MIQSRYSSKLLPHEVLFFLADGNHCMLAWSLTFLNILGLFSLIIPSSGPISLSCSGVWKTAAKILSFCELL
uniref:Uncharacterized protein n=1 Tax=Rhizophora mucronata TaxID=61149 RepID=A0A2P2K1J9_RHIMU